jgi:hypothetical protein
LEGLDGESQEDGGRSRPAESAIGPMKKMPHRGGVTVWPSLSVLSRKSATIFGQGTIPEPSTPHIGREVELVARTAAFVYI